ncbi:hypothetical protein QYM36_014675, partial [Artemia franciscana]
FVIAAFFKEKQIRTPMNMILLNLSISDLGMVTLGSSMSFVNALLKKWAFSQELCYLYALIMALCGISSITTLAVLALWRSIVVAMTLGKKWSMSFRQSSGTIIFIWVYSTGVTIPPVFGWGKFGEEYGGLSCSVIWKEKNSFSQYYVIYLFSFGLLLPLAVIVLSYSIILTAVNKKTNLHRSKLQTRITVMIGLMVASFLFTWSPYAIVALLETFGNGSHLQLYPSLVTVPSLFAKSSGLLNPFIYGCLNTQFQMAWRKILGLEQIHQPVTSKIDMSIPNCREANSRQISSVDGKLDESTNVNLDMIVFREVNIL